MSIYIQKKCITKNCNNLGRNKGLKLGKKHYAKKCVWCHRNRSVKDAKYGFTLNGVLNIKCNRCGWCEAPCDRHKKIPKLGYVKDNVVVLCPNCHRLVTLGIIKL